MVGARRKRVRCTGLLAVIAAAWIGCAAPSAGFEVDGWVSGMTLKEAVEVARKYDLSFSPDCSRAALGFDWDRAVYGWGKYREYCYFEYLMDVPAWVRLKFSADLKLERVVYKWYLRTPKNRRRLLQGIVGVIRSRYGEPLPCDVVGVKVSIFSMNNECYWDDETQSLVWVRWPLEEATAVYAEFSDGDPVAIRKALAEWEASKNRLPR